MTESEVLVKLVDEANRKGEKVQKENRRLKTISEKIFNKLLSKSDKILFREDDLSIEYKATQICTVGIDGSFYKIGGVGGKWYSPYAIVRILFEKGIISMPVVDVYSAGIEEIEEQKYQNVDQEASLRMLAGETKAISNWGAKNITSIVFIDGPIADPPAYMNRDYIENRCKAIKKSLTRSMVIGCVKRSRDAFFLKYFEKLLELKEGELEKNFLSDQYIFAYFFSNLRIKNVYKGVLYSRPIDISDYGVHTLYKEYGVHIYSSFYQKSIDSKILRIDIPFLETDVEKAEEIILKAIKASADWQYPKQYIPLPVQLAHEKCKIRGGTAEVLYDEILTKSRSSSVEEQITMLQLR